MLNHFCEFAISSLSVRRRINQNYERTIQYAKQKVLFITQGAVIAAIYVVLTYIVSLLGLTNGVIQVRLSEALTILPVFTPAQFRDWL
mgnify:CR=1 FL=1